MNPPSIEQLAEERLLLKSIESKVSELVTWKNAVSDLLYGNAQGDFGYFHKSNIIWRLIILWPVMILSIVFGAGFSLVIQRWILMK